MTRRQLPPEWNAAFAWRWNDLIESGVAVVTQNPTASGGEPLTYCL